MERAAFFANIRNRLGRIENQEVEAYNQGAPEFYKKITQSKDEMIAEFTRNLEMLSGKSVVVSNMEDAKKAIQNIVESHKAKSIVRWSHPLLNELQLDGNVTNWDKEASYEKNIELTKHADIGITSAEFAIANTGTVALFSDGNNGRSVSMLPPIYIVVFKADQLLPTMGHGISIIREKSTSSLNFVTGPSRSGDIELQLITGVHGPKYVYAIILDN